jgi:hypothetical protein
MSTMFLPKELSMRLKRGMIVATTTGYGLRGKHTQAQVTELAAALAEARAAAASGAILMEYDTRHISHIEPFVANTATAARTPTTTTTKDSTMPKRTPAEIIAASGLSPEDQAEVAAIFGITAAPSAHQSKSDPSGHQVKSAVAVADAGDGVRLDAVQAAKSFNAAQRRLKQ